MPIGVPGNAVPLEYGTEKHDRIRDFLRAGVHSAIRELSRWHDSIRYNEDQYRLWLKKPTNEGGNESTPSRNEKGQPRFESLLIPFGYANCSAAHMYASSVFLGRSPEFQFRGRHGETQDAEMATEAIINYQVTAGEIRKTLFHWLYDPFRYGAGIVGTYWDKEIVPMSRVVEVMETNPFTGQPQIRKKLVTQPEIGYQGNRVYPVRLLDFFWDPKVGLADFQKGDFAGEALFFTWMRLKELHARGIISDKNMEVLDTVSKVRTGDYRISSSGNFASITDDVSDEIRLHLEKLPKGLRSLVTKYGMTIHDSTWTIIPKAWGLSDSPYPEKWQFGMAGDEVVAYASPSGAPHGRYPYSALVYDIDLHEKNPRSLNTQSAPFERAMSWLFNSHVYNVRKHLNNTLIVDPTKVVVNDFYNRRAGGVVRMKTSAFGQDVRSFVHQLQVGDATQSHLNDMRTLESVGQRVTGINDNIMGLVNPGGRKTATEVRTASTFSTNRLKTVVEWFSATGFSDLSRQLVVNTQQFLEGEQLIKIVGDLLRTNEQTESFLRVTKEDIAGFYDFEPVDGSLPADRFAQGNLFREIYNQIIQNEALAQQYDLPRLTSFTASLFGIRNLDRFRLPPAQVISPEQLEQGRNEGNIVPLPGASAAQAGL